MQAAPSPLPVVSNTTPLISLAEVGLINTLQALYGELWIPAAVYGEYQAGLSAHPQRPSLDGFSWISVHSAPIDPAVPVTLDPGEAETIALARATGARLVLIDEQRGRSVARRLGLPLTGSVGVLIEAKAAGLIPLVGPYLDQMIAQGRRIGPRLRTQALTLAGEQA